MLYIDNVYKTIESDVFIYLSIDVTGKPPVSHHSQNLCNIRKLINVLFYYTTSLFITFIFYYCIIFFQTLVFRPSSSSSS